MGRVTNYVRLRRRPSASVGARAAKALVWIVGTTTVGVLALLILGALFPAVPAIGPVGSLASGFVGWMSLILLVATVATVAIAVRWRTRWRVAAAVVTTAVLVTAVTMTGTLIATGAQHGASINPLAGMPTPSTWDEQVEYSTFEGQSLTVTLWQPATTPADADAPVAVFAHGGGWNSGSNDQDTSGLKREMANRGWLVVSVNYTLATDTEPTWNIAEAQLGCAMIWAAANASHYGADISRLVLMGDSAGGNLAINAGSRANAGTLDASCEGTVPQVAAIATVYPGVDPYSLFDLAVPLQGHPGRDLITEYTGGTPDEFPERYAAVASQTHASAMMPPTLIVQGSNDQLVSADGVRQYVEQARESGGTVDLVEIPYADHVFDRFSMGAQLYNQITLNWLEERGL
jgi:acetyl esterase